ncbi:MAG TPA: polyprenyl diphosphate synthase [Clostridia bacterium]|nr:polyprenyl diphosphate synthase [Clostridia bacterium]
MKSPTTKLDPIPRHVGIIMDGNGRWAQMHGLPRTAGHQAGVQAARRTVETCGELGIRVLTLYTFSTENWCRPIAEVDFLMRLAEACAVRELSELQRNGVRLQLMGRREGLPATLLEVLDTAIFETQANSHLILNLAFNYGGRAEIVDAIKAILLAHEQGVLDASHLDEKIFARYLYLPETPDADLVIRTSGEWRLSNFLLWRAATSVFWSTPVLWPDFQREHLLEAIGAYREQTAVQNEIDLAA